MADAHSESAAQGGLSVEALRLQQNPGCNWLFYRQDTRSSADSREDRGHEKGLERTLRPEASPVRCVCVWTDFLGGGHLDTNVEPLSFLETDPCQKPVWGLKLTWPGDCHT